MPEKFLKELEDVKCIEGTEKVIFASKFCKPEAPFRWYKNKLEIFHGEKFNFKSEGEDYVLTINNVKLEDNGKFILECGKGPCKTSAWLYVEGEIKKITVVVNSDSTPPPTHTQNCETH